MGGTGAGSSGLSCNELQQLGAEVMLASTHQTLVRSGVAKVGDLGGLHRFLAWDGPLISDNGRHLPEVQPDQTAGRVVRVDDDGVTLASPVDGARHRLTPEESIAVQEGLGADVAVMLDAPARRRSLERSRDWAERAVAARTRDDQALFAAWEADDQLESAVAYARSVAQLPLDGLALYGRSDALVALAPVLPVDWPRLVVGCGDVLHLIAAIERGADLVECGEPLRLARAGRVYAPSGILDLTSPRLRDDPRPMMEGCGCYACSTSFARGYIRHLFAANELLAITLASTHNLYTIQDLTRQIRVAILDERLPELRTQLVARYGAGLAAG